MLFLHPPQVGNALEYAALAWTDGLRLISDLLFWVPGPPISLGSLRIEGGDGSTVFFLQ